MLTKGGKVTVPTSAAPSYLISPIAVQAVSIVQHTFMADQSPATFKPANRMDSLDDWELVTDSSLQSNSLRHGPCT